ncbi:MAG: PD40 domain-containing protein [Gemmatimonadaceae bacterium]|nr:PD40 domain-containing protein [Gemmatimonadaceae bacterium]
MLLLCAALPRLGAQVDPRGAVRTIETPHLRVHYPAALDSLARVAAQHGESAWQQLSASLAAPRGRVDMLLLDNTDVSNGFAQVFPSNRVVIYAVPPVASRELRFHDDWLRLVITHELAHVFHIDRARGIWRVGRAVFGRNPMLFPNMLAPSWVKEGIAVHYESAITGSGRALGTEFPLLARAAARDTMLPRLARWSLATTRFPRGQTAYGYGTQLIERAVAHGAARGDTNALRRYVDGSAGFIIPFALGMPSRRAFGASFQSLANTWLDSLQIAPIDRAGDGAWRVVGGDGYFAAAPRWLSNDSLMWSASNGRDITGLFVAQVGEARPERVAWRNSLDVQAPQRGASRSVFAQLEREDPYVVRSDLYARDALHGSDVRLTNGARLSSPDVRADGAIVAVQSGAAITRLVRVSADGSQIVPLTVDRAGELWADPRWSPDGRWIAAVQWVPSGERRVVVLDTAGAVREVVTGSRAVYSSPSFTPDGSRLVWASDRSGRMQIETAPLQVVRAGGGDTTQWRTSRADVRVASSVSTGAYEPSVSPDGLQVAALVQRSEGFLVAVAPLDTNGAMAVDSWYRVPTKTDARVGAVTSPSKSYSPWRMLMPRYWLPLMGQGRLGDATYGASSSSVDILERHTWFASALVAPNRGEVDAAAGYRYAGLGVPVFDVSASQDWDGTFGVVNDSNVTLGLVARRRQFLTASTTVSVPRIRWSLSQTLGVQYERRDFTADVDSALGAPNSLLRRGTRYPSVFASTAFSTARLAGRSISIDEGFTLSQNTSYRWREDQPSLGSWRTLVSGRAYVPLPFPGFARHVIALRGVAGVADTRTATEFSVGGTSGTAFSVVPGLTVGDPSRSFPVRGVLPGAQRGIRAVGASAEYRLPFAMFERAALPFTLYADRMSITMFSDAARAWCPAALARTNTAVCERPGVRDGILASAGMEFVFDLAVQYDVPYRLRVGGAVPYAAPSGIPRRGGVYVSFGGFF